MCWLSDINSLPNALICDGISFARFTSQMQRDALMASDVDLHQPRFPGLNWRRKAYKECPTGREPGGGFSGFSAELDHLNRARITELFARHLKAILMAPAN
jgi:hypothetical protein